MDDPQTGQPPVKKRIPRLSSSIVGLWLTACGTVPPSGGVGAIPPVRPIPAPDLSVLDSAIADRIRERFSAWREAETHPADAAARAAANGALGKLLLAAQLYDQASIALANAHALEPQEMRWPYLLGHVHKRSGAVAKAVPFFEEAYRLQATSIPALVWLADAYLSLGRIADAERLLHRGLELDPSLVSARYYLGRAALARRDFAAAATELEAALALDPKAESVHYPLAMAYRGLGQQDRAQAHLALRRRGDVEVPPPDPLMREVDDLVETPAAFELRGIQAMDRKDWAAAAAQFRKGLKQAPANASLRQRLGTALFMSGSTGEAVEQFQEALRVAPGYARAHYSLGVLLETSGRETEAIAQYGEAVASEPTYLEARLRLSRVLRRTGHAEAALTHYEKILAQDPSLADAALGHALTLIRLRRYSTTRAQLSEYSSRFPNQRVFKEALARVLAASPDASVRDGRTALALVQDLLKTEHTVDLGETLAMALAETGDFTQASEVQRDILAAVRQQGGRPDLLDRLTANLRLYEAGRPCRQPWVEEPELPEATGAIR